VCWNEQRFNFAEKDNKEPIGPMTNAANACCVQQEWVAKNLEARMAKEGPAEIFTGEKARRDQGSRRDPKPGQNWNCNLS